MNESVDHFVAPSCHDASHVPSVDLGGAGRAPLPRSRERVVVEGMPAAWCGHVGGRAAARPYRRRAPWVVGLRCHGAVSALWLRECQWRGAGTLADARQRVPTGAGRLGW
ncbi:MAG: hypothetical protein ACFHW5_20510 [Verrucomicrobiota bacterium]